MHACMHTHILICEIPAKSAAVVRNCPTTRTASCFATSVAIPHYVCCVCVCVCVCVCLSVCVRARVRERESVCESVWCAPCVGCHC